MLFHRFWINNNIFNNNNKSIIAREDTHGLNTFFLSGTEYRVNYILYFSFYEKKKILKYSRFYPLLLLLLWLISMDLYFILTCSLCDLTSPNHIFSDLDNSFLFFCSHWFRYSIRYLNSFRFLASIQDFKIESIDRLIQKKKSTLQMPKLVVFYPHVLINFTRKNFFFEKILVT